MWGGGAVLVLASILLMLFSKRLDAADNKMFDSFGGQRNKPGRNGRVGFVLGLIGLAMIAVAVFLTVF